MNVVTLLVVVIIAFIVPPAISSLLGLDMFNPHTLFTIWLMDSTIILVASIVIFFILKILGILKSPILTALSAVTLASILFSVFAWFNFPHFNEIGFESCKSLAFKPAQQNGGEDTTTGITFTFNRNSKLNKGNNLGIIDTFIKENGEPSGISNTYTYTSKKGHSCSLTVNESGVIQEAEWFIP